MKHYSFLKKSGFEASHFTMSHHKCSVAVGSHLQRSATARATFQSKHSWHSIQREMAGRPGYS